MTYVSLLVGFILLIKGADYFVEGSSAVARKFHIPSMVIGMTIVAMGTSLPECAVSVTASIAGSNELAVSNVVGSNIFNLMVVCGACTLWTPMAVSQKTLKQELPFSIAMGVILLILGYSGMAISRADGLIFLVIFVCFLMWMVRAAKANPVQPEEEEPKMLPGWKCALYILLGGAAIMWGGDLVDILFHFICRHTKSVIDELQSLLIRVHQNLYLRFIFLRKCILTHHIQLLQLGDGIASVGNQFTEENIVVRIQPFFNNRENIVAVNGK